MCAQAPWLMALHAGGEFGARPFGMVAQQHWMGAYDHA
jgi:hypothetical protein